MPKTLQVQLVEKVELIKDIFKFSVKSKELAEESKPGQFLEIRVNDEIVPFLRRPISIHNIEKTKDIVEFIFQIRGEGTKILAKKEIGDFIDVLGPLGNGVFETKNYKNIAIIGGGIGIFPLYELAKSFSNDIKIKTYLGFRNKDLVLLEKEFENVSTELILATDDGSYGKKGFAINYLKEDINKNKYDCIYACGPMPMLKAVQEISKETGIPAQISLEQLMGCGFGVCLGCAVKNNTKGKYDRVCKEGPVFLATDMEL